MSGVLLAALAALLVLVAGGAPLHVPAGPLLGRVGGATLAGLVALHLGLTVADPFTAWTGGLAVGLALLAALVWRMGVPRCELPRLSRPGWGLVVAALPLALYGALASVRLAHLPDFVFHWGIKAQWWLLAGGVDFEALSRVSSWRLNPGYPQLVPEVMALPGMLGGGWNDRAALLVAPGLAVVIVLTVRHVARRAGVAPLALEVTTALAGIVVGGFGFIHGGAGGADDFMALAVVSGTAALIDPDWRASAVAVGLAAALAAGAKVEGFVWAAVLIAVDAVRTVPLAGTRALVRRLPWTVLPAGAVLALWSVREGRFYLPTRAEPPDLERWTAVARAIGEATTHLDGGLLAVLLLALPWCAARPRLRAAAAAVAALGLSYVAVYLLAPSDQAFLVVSTFARLAYQLLPATIVLLAVATVPATPRRTPAPTLPT